ncbi:MAG: hypothetical protein LBJ00_08785 [Planctomycetaceae bacterium]|nr:hypothetical protein [Planctomycetaceae bacterium]
MKRLFKGEAYRHTGYGITPDYSRIVANLRFHFLILRISPQNLRADF